MDEHGGSGGELLVDEHGGASAELAADEDGGDVCAELAGSDGFDDVGAECDAGGGAGGVDLALGGGGGIELGVDDGEAFDFGDGLLIDEGKHWGCDEHFEDTEALKEDLFGCVESESD